MIVIIVIMMVRWFWVNILMTTLRMVLFIVIFIVLFIFLFTFTFVYSYLLNQFRAAEYLLNDEDDEKNRKKLNKAQRKSIFVRKNKVKKGDSSSEDVNIEVANTVAKAIEEVDELEKERTAEQLKELEAHQLNLLPEVFYLFVCPNFFSHP